MGRRIWTRDEIARAICEWIEKYQFAPERKHWRPSEHKPGSIESEYFNAPTPTGEPRWPTINTVVDPFADAHDPDDKFPTWEHAIYFALTGENYPGPHSTDPERAHLRSLIPPLVATFLKSKGIAAAKPQIEEQAIALAAPAIRRQAVQDATPEIEDRTLARWEADQAAEHYDQWVEAERGFEQDLKWEAEIEAERAGLDAQADKEWGF